MDERDEVLAQTWQLNSALEELQNTLAATDVAPDFEIAVPALVGLITGLTAMTVQNTTKLVQMSREIDDLRRHR